MTFLRKLLTPARKQMAVHVVIVFAVAFGGQVVDGLTKRGSVPTLTALLVAAASAGLIAAAHYVVGLIPMTRALYKRLR